MENARTGTVGVVRDTRTNPSVARKRVRQTARYDSVSGKLLPLFAPPPPAESSPIDWSASWSGGGGEGERTGATPAAPPVARGGPPAEGEARARAGGGRR